jgi:hypothetical protein
MKILRHLFWIFFGLMLMSAAMGFVVGRATAQDCETGTFGCGHHPNHDDYKEWTSPTGMSCCNGQDCRPVRAQLEMSGQWSIWIPEYRQWVPVPATAKMEPDKLHDGRSHACTADPLVWKEYGRPAAELPIYCFTNAEPKS